MKVVVEYLKAFFVVMGLLLIANTASAAGLSNQGQSELNSIKTWLYGCLGIAAFIYIMYLIVMAFLGKGEWRDAIIGLMQVAGAGAVLVIVDYMWQLFT